MEASMNEADGNRQEQQRCWAGLDWGSEEHTVSVVNDARKVLGKFKVEASLKGLEQLVKRLGGFGRLTGIAIEATRNPVVNYLVSAGFTVYPINPKLSKNWRACNSVAGVKSDERDGLVLAVELAGRHASLRALEREDPAEAELAGLCEKLRDLVDERTSLLQRLKATLGQYYPGVLGFFTDWTSPVAWRFLQRFPRPEALAHARKDTLIRFLKANRIGIKPIWLERIEARSEVTRWPDPGDRAALEAMALAIIAQLQGLQPHIDKMDRLIAESARHLPHAYLLKSLPGAGKRLAPVLAAITAPVASGETEIEAIRCVSGVAPVEDQSGKRHRVCVRRRCNKHWRDVMHLFAFSSTHWCSWAKVFYDMRREQGDHHASALRKLADKWLKIINRMLQTGEPYDDQRYVDALRKNGSPIYLRLAEKTCG
jgi:transposase